VLFLWKPLFFKNVSYFLGRHKTLGPPGIKGRGKHNKVGARITKKDRTSKNISEKAIKSYKIYKTLQPKMIFRYISTI